MNPSLHYQTVMAARSTDLTAGAQARLAAEVGRCLAMRAAVVRARARLADAVGRQAATPSAVPHSAFLAP